MCTYEGTLRLGVAFAEQLLVQNFHEHLTFRANRHDTSTMTSSEEILETAARDGSIDMYAWYFRICDLAI